MSLIPVILIALGLYIKWTDKNRENWIGTLMIVVGLMFGVGLLVGYIVTKFFN